MGCIRIMGLGRARRELVQEYLAGIRAGEVIADPELRGDIRDIGKVVAHVCVIRLLPGLQFSAVIAVAQDAHIKGLSRREQAQALQVLIGAGELIDYGIVECQVGVNGRQPGNL